MNIRKVTGISWGFMDSTIGWSNVARWVFSRTKWWIFPPRIGFNGNWSVQKKGKNLGVEPKKWPLTNQNGDLSSHGVIEYLVAHTSYHLVNT